MNAPSPIRPRPRRASHRGVALVEFALILPLLLVLTFITTEFGRAIYQYSTVTKQVRDAARYLSMQLPNTHLTEARNLVVYGKTTVTGSDQPLTRGLTLSNVPDPTWQNAGSDPIITTVQVQVTGYSFRSLFTSFFGLPVGTIAFAPISATMRSHL